MAGLFWVGEKPGYGIAMKVLKDAADDPLTLPNSDYDRYIFNSETSEIAYVDFITSVDIANTPWAPNTNGLHSYYTPAGYASPVMHARYSITGSYHKKMYTVLLENMGFSYPTAVLWSRFTVDTGKYVGPQLYWTKTGDAGTPGGKYWGTYTGNPFSFCRVITLPPTADDYPPGYTGYLSYELMQYWPAQGFNDWPYGYTVSVLDLPMDDTPLLDVPAPAPHSDPSILFSPSRVVVARAGHSVNSAEPHALIMDSDRIPVMLLASGSITVPAFGTVTVDTPLPLTQNVLIDYQVNKSGYYRCHPPFQHDGTAQAQQIIVTAEIGPSSVTFVNGNGTALELSYIIAADDDSAPTSGGSKVLERLNDGTQDYLRIKRPGSSDVSPGLNDIMLDSRLPTLPVVAEGVLTRAGDFAAVSGSPHTLFGALRATVTFENTGFQPYVMYFCKLVNPSNGYVSWSTPQTLRWVTWLGTYPPNGFGSSHSLAWIQNAQVDFYISNTNIYAWGDDGNGNPFPYGGQKVEEIRYYVFAVPN